MEPKNDGFFIGISSSRGSFSGSMLVFGGVKDSSLPMGKVRCLNFLSAFFFQLNIPYMGHRGMIDIQLHDQLIRSTAMAGQRMVVGSL